MGYWTVVGWSLITAGIVTLALTALPWEPLWIGLGLIIGGLASLTLGHRRSFL